MQVNTRGVYLAIQIAGRSMIPFGAGRSSVTASTNALSMGSGLIAFNASKAAAVALVRTSAMELAPHGVTVNAVAPGLIRAPMTKGLTSDPEAAQRSSKSIPLRQFGEPEEVAAAVAFLASDEAAWITGHVLVVDGGQTLGTPFPA